MDCSSESVGSILENYNVLIELWDECLDTKLEPDRIIGVKTQMSHYKLLFGLHPCERFLKITDNLSKTLRTESLSALEAQQIAKYTIQSLQGMRTDDIFDLFSEHVESLLKQKNPIYQDGEGLQVVMKLEKEKAIIA